MRTAAGDWSGRFQHTMASYQGQLAYIFSYVASKTTPLLWISWATSRAGIHTDRLLPDRTARQLHQQNSLLRKRGSFCPRLQNLVS